jgi:hypothetical protein
LKSTTVQTDDYLDLLMAAKLECVPRPVPAEHQGQGHVQLALSFPPGSSPDQEALAHLLDRLSHPEAVLSFGVDTLLTHPSLDGQGSCVRHVPGRDPFFRLLALTQQGGSGLLLDLSPTSPQDAFRYLSFSLEHTPDAQVEVERRRALGLWTGRPLDVSSARQLVTFSRQVESYGVNWNGNTASPGAANPKISVFSAQPDALYCSNCYFYVGATLNIKVLVCAILKATISGYIYYYDPDLPERVMKSGYGYYYTTSSSDTNPGAIKTSDADAKARTDCIILDTPTPAIFNVGLSAEVYFSGSASFSFTIKSDGISASSPLAFPARCAAPSSSCDLTQLPGMSPVEIPTITVPVLGIPITIDPKITLTGAAVGSLNMPALKLQFGASASVNVKLGGKVSFAGLPSVGPPELDIEPYSTFTASYAQAPFQLSGFTSASGSIDATIAPRIEVLIWKILPFTIVPRYSMVQTLAVGGRQLGLRGELLEGGATVVQRSRALASCASGQVSSTATAKGALSVKLNSVKAFAMIESITGVDMSKAVGGIAANADVIIIPTTTILDPASTSFSVEGAVAAASSACVAAGSSISTGGTVSAGGSTWGTLGSSAAAGSDFLSLAVALAIANPKAAAEASQAVTTPLVGAILAPLLFLACLFACSRAPTALNLCCCPISEDDTAPWKASAPTAKWRFLGACYCYLQGAALVAAGFGMPWASFSADITLPLLAAVGLAICDPSIKGTPLQTICNGGTLMTAGAAMFYVAIVLGFIAWIITWVLTIRARNLAHQSTIPKSSCCGSLPAALYVGAASTLLSFVGVIITWSGYNTFISLIPPEAVTLLKLGAPPGGVAVIVGFLFLFLGNLALWWANAALGGTPVAFMTGASFTSCTPVTGQPGSAVAGSHEKTVESPLHTAATGRALEASHPLQAAARAPLEASHPLQSAARELEAAQALLTAARRLEAAQTAARGLEASQALQEAARRLEAAQAFQTAARRLEAARAAARGPPVSPAHATIWEVGAGLKALQAQVGRLEELGRLREAEKVEEQAGRLRQVLPLRLRAAKVQLLEAELAREQAQKKEAEAAAAAAAEELALTKAQMHEAGLVLERERAAAAAAAAAVRCPHCSGTQEPPRVSPPPPPTTGNAATVLACFDAGDSREKLSVHKGERVILVAEDSVMGEWVGVFSCNSGRTGWVPASYIHVARAMASRDYDAFEEGAVSLRVPQRLVVCGEEGRDGFIMVHMEGYPQSLGLVPAACIRHGVPAAPRRKSRASSTRG